MAMGGRLDDTLDSWRVVPNHTALPPLGGIPPHPGLLAMQQRGQYLTVMPMGRRSRDRMKQCGPAVHADLGLHADIPRMPLRGLMPLRIPLLRAMLR